MVQWFNGSMVQWFNLRRLMMLIVVVNLLFNVNTSNSQYLTNGSFEIHRVGEYPFGNTDKGIYDYHELMRCLNFCPTQIYHNYQFPPILCIKENGWFSPTLSSPDYYHVLGTYDPGRYKDASIPRNCSWAGNIGPDPDEPLRNRFYPKYDTLYPYNYYNGLYIDSAYIALGVDLRSNDGNIQQMAYKEYLQIKLNQPMTAGVYFVNFKVSRSAYSKQFSSLCAVFSNGSIVAPNSNLQERQGPWYENLAWYFHKPYDYIYINKTQKNAICSEELLYKKAGYDFTDNWQLVGSQFVVPQDSTYYYLTIGNFQSDDELIQELKVNNNISLNNGIPNDAYFYYFIDDINISPVNQCSLYDCNCNYGTIPFDVTKDESNIDSTKCCYIINFEIPNQSISSGVCPISKLQIKKNAEVIWEESVNSAPYYMMPGKYSRSFCLDKFSSNENNSFTLLFYRKIENSTEDTLISKCSRELKLNCVCTCSDLEAYPFPPLKPKIFVKKVTSQNDDCCWDIVINNPESENSSSCEFDLSNKKILLHNTNSTYPYYDFSALNGFTYTSGVTQDRSYKYFNFPSDFKIKPGEEVIIGQICSKETESGQDLEFELSIGDLTTLADTCTGLVKQVIKCDSVETSCCDLISYDFIQNPESPFFVGCLDFGSSTSTQSFCCYPVNINFKFTPDNCFIGDTLSIIIYDFDNPNNIFYSELIDFSNMLFQRKTLTWIKVPPGQKRRFCINVKDLRTNQTCTYCDSLSCLSLGTEGLDEQEIQLFKTNNKEINEPENIFISPNPVSDEFISVKIIEAKENSCNLQLFNNELKEVYQRNSIMLKKGENNLKIPIQNLSSGQYYLNLNYSGSVLTRKIIIIR